MKPGTRCECREIGNKCHDGTGSGDGECRTDAVRLVTVREPNDPPAGTQYRERAIAFQPYVLRRLALCAACAEHAEKGGAR